MTTKANDSHWPSSQLDLVLDTKLCEHEYSTEGGTWKEPSPRLSDECPDTWEEDAYYNEYQLDMFEDLWAENLKQKYGISHPMSEDE